jgi:hypothetical protein
MISILVNIWFGLFLVSPILFIILVVISLYYSKKYKNSFIFVFSVMSFIIGIFLGLGIIFLHMENVEKN